MSTEVTLEEVLAFREHISERRAMLTEKYALPVITFTMNMAGSVKRTGLSDFAFRCGISALKNRLGNAVFEDVTQENAGVCGFLVYSEAVSVLKQIAMETESSEVGRLYDIDVSDEHGNVLHRGEMRRCLLCDGSAAECGRSRAHPIELLQRKTEEILLRFASEYLGETAYFALIWELSLTPKPGLVDRNNCGAHADMRYEDFERSAAALLPFFEKAVLMGYERADFLSLQALGAKAEKAMFQSTNGVNTHKGANFIFMLLLYACGEHLSDGCDIFSVCSALSLQKERVKNTHGAKMNEKYGGGVLEEAKNGFPTAGIGADALGKGDSPLRVFFKIMSLCEDTNLLWRGGASALDFARNGAKNALALTEAELYAEALRLDEEFIRRNISPGGSADLFSTAVFLNKIKGLLY